ncbi:MAG: cation:proton antiporter, partial [Candidatus Sumerlaeia bacterium]|nr:cation:proton antiporter [Candidatus Sumerlaeia bacterium]
IGLSFSLRKMKLLGVSLPLATVIAALFILLLSRTTSFILGISDLQGLFIAGILMVSSSAIIAKVLEEMRSNHSRWGQLSLGVTLMEDIVAIVMLTLLTSMVYFGDDGSESVWMILAAFMGFVALFSVVVILLVPRLLRWLDLKGISELRMLVVAGLLLGLGWLSVYLGYSMALTAFILGAIIGSTPQRGEVDRLFEGLRHLFGAVFFVAMGMMFNVTLLPEFWPMMLALIGAAIILRAIAMLVALLLTGNVIQDSIRASLTLTPLGEFSFVIAFLGISSGVMPETFYPAAVGASLITCLISPALIRRSETISRGIEGAIPATIHRGIETYHQWLENLHAHQNRSLAWKLILPRLIQTVVLLLLVGGLLALTSPIYGLMRRGVGENLLFPNGTMILLIIAVGLFLLPPVVAIWRNVSALSMIVAEAAAAGRQQNPLPSVLVERAIASACIAFAAVWLFALIPTGALPYPLLAAVLAILILTTILLWKKLILWQSRMEISFRRELTVAQGANTHSEGRWNLEKLDKGRIPELRLEEFTLPADSLHSGHSIIELRLRPDYSCSIVGIDRQGYAINNPSAKERLFPGDKLLLLGTEKALAEAVTFLSRREAKPQWLDRFDNLATEQVHVPTPSSCNGGTLRDLNLVDRFGIQIAAIKRGETEIVSPGASTQLEDGDTLLVVGTHDSIRAFAEALAVNNN